MNRLLMLALVLLCAQPAWAGKLDKVRSKVKGKKSASSHDSSGGSGSVDTYDGSDTFLAFYVIASPWWLPHLAVGDRYGRPFAFDSHPYASGYDGFVHVGGRSAPMAATGQGGRSLLGRGAAMQLAVEGGWLDPTLQRIGLSARISGAHRFEIETSWAGYQELLGPAERQSGRLIDALWLGDVNVTWLHAVGESVQFRSGLGLRTMVDAGETSWGVNATYGMDLFPFRPLVVSASADLGTVGSALYRGARITLGFMIGAVEIYGGWDGAWVDEIALGGGVFGVRGWL